MVLFGLGWFSRAEFGMASTTKSATATAPRAATIPNHPPMPIGPQPAQPLAVTPAEIQQMRAARQTALDSNPDLAAEYKQIQADLQAQQARLEADMIKADPKVAPLIAKMAELRQRSLAHATSPMPVAH
jgi:CHAT domain-containing protein